MKPPERRRALIIGAGPTGMSAAFHLGEHSLLVEQRHSLEHFHDYSNGFPMGPAHGGALGGEDAGADGVRYTSPTEKALIISCSTRAHDETGEHTLIQVEPWCPPDLSTQRTEPGAPPSLRTLRPLLRGELRMDAQVTRVAPAAHLLELANGHRYIYDKLLSTLSLAATEALVSADLPRHVRRGESLRYWLSEHDVEVADQATLESYGDLDEFAMGKRFADQIGVELALKFGKTRSTMRGARLFQPRLVMP